MYNTDNNNTTGVDEIEPIPVTTNDVSSRMIVLRNQPVLIDADVAELYGVQTKEVNQAVRNNPQKFPFGYFLNLTNLRRQRWSKILTGLIN